MVKKPYRNNMQYEPVRKGFTPPEAKDSPGQHIPGNKAEARNHEGVGQGKKKQQGSGIAPPEQNARIRRLPAASPAQMQKVPASHGSASFLKK
jgi:hypothetical protein